MRIVEEREVVPIVKLSSSILPDCSAVPIGYVFTFKSLMTLS